jgi:hypothetical protein
MTVKTWQQRLDELDTSKGVSNVMRQNCMKAEILELRAALRRQTARAERASERAKTWRAHATRYQQQLAAKAKQ